jgi:hypothetical protein
VPEVPAARRVLVVPAIGLAPFATTGQVPDPAETCRSFTRNFTRSLGWLLDHVAKAPA